MDHLILVRHARTLQDPHTPSARWVLGDDAPAACARLAERLAPLGPDRVLTGVEAKMVTTGALLARALGLPEGPAVGLEEHDRTGVPFVRDPEEWQATLERLFREPDRRVLGRETARQALDRFEAAVRREVERHPGETLALVSGATVMSLFIARHNDLDAYRFWRTVAMPEAFVLELPDFTLAQRLGAGGA